MILQGIYNTKVKSKLDLQKMSMKKKKEPQQLDFKLKLKQSEYTKLYKVYMQKQYPMVETIVKKIVQMPFCQQYYLKYPLDGLLRGVCKKMLINVYELTVFGYFLSEVEWRLDPYIFATLSEVFPNVIHVNEPTDNDKLKELSIFLYFSSYSIKEFLNQDISIYRDQMSKIIPEFQHIQNSWTSSQQTVGQILNPRLLNKFYQEAHQLKNFPDYNFCVDKILQISPCYDITSKTQKGKQIYNFGYMEIHNRPNDFGSNFGMNQANVTDMYFHNPDNDNPDNEIKIDGMDINNYEYDGGEI